MNNKSFLIIIIVISVSLSSLFGEAVVNNSVEAAAEPMKEADSILDTQKLDSKNVAVSEVPSQPILDVKADSTIEEVFQHTPLTEGLKDKINNVSWKDIAPYPIDDLAYIEVTYLGFDGEIHIGALIMHKLVAPEIIDIFKELYDHRFPIEKIGLIDEYNADDNASMNDNNTSALCVRNITNRANGLSRHAFGVAIDINPIQNPYISSEIVLPEAGNEYLDRSDIRRGMIVEGDVCYNAFVSRGWTWGGNWETIKDYQHFQKDLDIPINAEIPDITSKQLNRLLENALVARNEILLPYGDEQTEQDGNVYIRYSENLDSKHKMMSFLREYYTNEVAETVLEGAQIQNIDGSLFGLWKENENIDIDFSEIQKMDTSGDERLQKYSIMDMKGGRQIIEIKYIGSQGWRINKIEKADMQ